MIRIIPEVPALCSQCPCRSSFVAYWNLNDIFMKKFAFIFVVLFGFVLSLTAQEREVKLKSYRPVMYTVIIILIIL